MLYGIIATIVVIGIIVLFARRAGSYYGKIYSDEHFAEMGNWLVAVLKRGPVFEPRLEDNTALVSSAGCALSFTRTIDDNDTIHIAISQIDSVTTHAVSSRIAFLVVRLLQGNKASANFYYTESHVHHMVFTKDIGGDWITSDVAFAVDDMKLYEPVPFQFESAGE